MTVGADLELSRRADIRVTRRLLPQRQRLQGFGLLYCGSPAFRHRPRFWITFRSAPTLLAGCVTKVYRPGAPDSPLNRIKLGESYDDMVKMLGPPSQSFSQDRSNKVAAAAMIPIYGLVDIASNHNPSSVQSYHYDHIGTVTIDNDDRIIRVEADEWSPPHADIGTGRGMPAPAPHTSGPPHS